jgi:hypothetical protein
VKINYHLTEDETQKEIDLADWYSKKTSRRPRKGCVSWWFALILLISAELVKYHSGFAYVVLLISSIGLFLYLIVLYLKGDDKRSTYKPDSAKKLGDMEPEKLLQALPRELTLIGDQLTVEDSFDWLSFKPRMIKNIVSVPSYIFILARSQEVLLIPRSAIVDIADIQSWAVQRNIAWIERPDWNWDLL